MFLDKEKRITKRKVPLKIAIKKSLSDPRRVVLFLMEQTRLHQNKKNSQKIGVLSNRVKLDTDEFCEKIVFERPTYEEIELVSTTYDTLLEKVRIAYSNVTDGNGFSIISTEDAKAIYWIVRISKPRVIVETGVSDGMSTSIILSALHRNGEGLLYSIDLPDVGMPQLIDQKPGWLVEDRIRDKWVLSLGDSKKILPDLCKRVGKVDIFLHDSEHSYENMSFEFNTVYSYMSKEGVLLSDDSFGNDAVLDFAAKIGINYDKVAFSKQGLAGIRILKS